MPSNVRDEIDIMSPYSEGLTAKIALAFTKNLKMPISPLHICNWLEPWNNKAYNQMNKMVKGRIGKDAFEKGEQSARLFTIVCILFGVKNIDADRVSKHIAYRYK